MKRSLKWMSIVSVCALLTVFSANVFAEKYTFNITNNTNFDTTYQEVQVAGGGPVSAVIPAAPLTAAGGTQSFPVPPTGGKLLVKYGFNDHTFCQFNIVSTKQKPEVFARAHNPDLICGITILGGTITAKLGPPGFSPYSPIFSSCHTNAKQGIAFITSYITGIRQVALCKNGTALFNLPLNIANKNFFFSMLTPTMEGTSSLSLSPGGSAIFTNTGGRCTFLKNCPTGNMYACGWGLSTGTTSTGTVTATNPNGYPIVLMPLLNAEASCP